MTTQLLPFDSSDVADVLAEVAGGMQENLRRELTSLMDRELREFLFGLVNMPKLGNLGAPQVMLRVRTFQTILDDFRGALGDQYDGILKRIGRGIGFNFAITLLRVLRHANRVPKKYDALLEFWAKFDSAAQMGDFKFAIHELSDEQARVEVNIRDLFVTLGYGDDEPLRHCPFITGYLEGALDTSMFLWTRWIRESDFKDPQVLWSVSACDEIVRESPGLVRFNVTLKKEPLPTLKDILARAVDLSETERWGESIITGRVALERSVVCCAQEEPPELKVSFGRVLEQLERVRADLDFEVWRRTYDECSKPAHQVKTLNEVTVTNILFNVWRCVKETESLTLAPELVAEIKKNHFKYVIP